MTGHAVRDLRISLGVTSRTFAALFGVNPSTIYRWESRAERAVVIEGLPRIVLTLLAQRARLAGDPAALGATLTDAIVQGGTLRALAVLVCPRSPVVSA